MSENKNQWDITEIATQAQKLIESNFKVVLGVFIVSIIGGSAWTYIQSMQAQNERDAFKDLYQITKIYEETKSDFEKAEQQKLEKEAKKEAKVDDKSKEPEKTYASASGDLEKDYGPVVSQLETFIDKNKSKNAAAEAALVLSEIYEEYNQVEKGTAALEKVLKNWPSKNVLYFVMQMRVGDLFAAKNICENALPHWKEVAGSESFIKDQARLKLGVCLQEVGRIDEAIQEFELLTQKSPDTSEAFNAKRYLRFLKFKKNNPDSFPNSKAQKNSDNNEKAS